MISSDVTIYFALSIGPLILIGAAYKLITQKEDWIFFLFPFIFGIIVTGFGIYKIMF